MVREAPRKCSNCGNTGHNLRTCLGNNNNNKGGLKLFGVQILLKKEQEKVIKKSSSTGDLNNTTNKHDHKRDEYLSDGQPNRKKGHPWTKEEHQLFLMGLQALGRGEWKGIAKKYVTSRSPSQVASHAQKYFIRLAASEEKKIRPSVFDALLQEPVGVDGNGQKKFAVGSCIPIMLYSYGPVTINFSHQTSMYLPQGSSPC